MRCAWGTAQEGAALLQVMRAFPGSQLAEVGLCRVDAEDLPPEWGFAPGSLPPLGASPDALLRHALPAGEAEQATLALRQVLAQMQLGGKEGQLGGTTATTTPSATTTTYLVEVVEVKNSCPFGVPRSAVGRAGAPAKYVLRDHGPREQVPPEWVPQLQMHMLCTGTASVLLVSRSATKGTRMFRLRRDDALLQSMLRGERAGVCLGRGCVWGGGVFGRGCVWGGGVFGARRGRRCTASGGPFMRAVLTCALPPAPPVLSLLWRQHVVPRRAPPREWGVSSAEHHALLKLTLQVRPLPGW